MVKVCIFNDDARFWQHAGVPVRW